MAYLPQPVLDLAARQFGITTIDDLLTIPDLEVTRPMVNGWVARGYLERAHRGVYRLTGTTALPEQRHYAALRRAGRGARLSGTSALSFLGAEGFEHDGPDVPFVIIPPGRRLTNVDFTWVAATVPNKDAATLPGSVLGVTPTRALIDAAASVGAKRVRVAYDDLRRRGLVRRVRLIERAHELSDEAPGARAILDIAALGDLDKESEGERALSTVFGVTDPWPLWQVWVARARLDALFPEARLALEYHGRQHHRLPEDQARDRERAERLLAEEDVEVLVVWWEDLHERVALRARILGRRVARIRAGVTPLRNFRLA